MLSGHVLRMLCTLQLLAVADARRLGLLLLHLKILCELEHSTCVRSAFQVMFYLLAAVFIAYIGCGLLVERKQTTSRLASLPDQLAVTCDFCGQARTSVRGHPLVGYCMR